MGTDRFAEYELQSPNFGNDLVLLPDGVVVLSTNAFPDGCRIDDYQFGGQLTASRPAGFGETLAVHNSNGEAYYFRFDGIVWRRRVPLAVTDQPLTYSIHKKLAHHGFAGTAEFLIKAFVGTVIFVPLWIFLIWLAYDGHNPIAILACILLPLGYLSTFLRWYRDPDGKRAGRRK